MRRSPSTPPCGTILLFAFGLGGCGPGTVLHTGGPYPEPGPSEGVRYYVARDLVVVEGTVAARSRTQWARLAPGDSAAECKPGDSKAQTDTLVYRLSTMTVPDRSRAFRLAVRPSKSTKQTVSIGVSQTGILTGINYQAEDQTGEIVTNLIKGVAGLAGTFVGAAALAETTLEKASEGQPYVPSDEECFLRSTQGAGFRSIPALAAELDAILNARQAVAAAANRATTRNGLSVLRGRDSLLAAGAALVEGRLSTLRALLSAGAAAYAKSQGVGTKVSPMGSFRYLFDVTELPPIPNPQSAEVLNIPLTDARRPLLDQAGLMLAVFPLPTGTAGTPPDPADTSTGSIGCPGNVPPDKCARIHFRMPAVRRLVVYRRQAGPSAPALSAIEEITTPLASSADPVLNVALSTERLGSGGLKVAFGPHGNLTSFEQATTAAGASAAASFVNAISQSRAEFQAGLKAVADAQGTALGIEQSARAARIKEIQDQKALLDAELLLQGASASKALLLQKQQLDAELALLTSQQALDAKREPSEASQLRAEIEVLKLQIELLKVKAELEKETRAGPPAGASPAL